MVSPQKQRERREMVHDEWLLDFLVCFLIHLGPDPVGVYEEGVFLVCPTCGRGWYLPWEDYGAWMAALEKLLIPGNPKEVINTDLAFV